MALKQQELDPEVKLFSQFEDTTDKTTILPIRFQKSA